MTSDHGSESRTSHGLLILQLGNLWAPDVFLWVLTQTKSEFWHVLTCFQMFSQVTSVFIVSPMSNWFQFHMIPLFLPQKALPCTGFFRDQDDHTKYLWRETLGRLLVVRDPDPRWRWTSWEAKKRWPNSKEIDRYSNTLYAPCMVCLPTWLDDTGYWVHC